MDRRVKEVESGWWGEKSESGERSMIETEKERRRPKEEEEEASG